MTKSLRRTLMIAASAAAALALGPPAASHAATPMTDRDPVVLAAGAALGETPNSLLAKRLRDAGFDVSIYVIPTPLGSLPDTAPSLATFVADVRRRTGAAKVDIVNHSQSGLLTRYFIKYLGGATQVDSVVSLSGLHQGSKLANLTDIIGGPTCVGLVLCEQLAPGSAFLRDLNEPVQAIGDIHYVNIASRADTLAIPSTNNFMYGPGDITNVLVQDQCPLRLPTHLGMILDGTVASGVVKGLREEAVRLDCSAV